MYQVVQCTNVCAKYFTVSSIRELFESDDNHIILDFVCMYVSFGQGSSLLYTHTLRPFYSRPIALTQEGSSLVNDVCECVHD